VSGNCSKNRARRHRRYHEQGGLCWWCKQPMELDPVVECHKPMPPRMCTTDHLRDRFDQTRQELNNGEKRIVAACWECNTARGNQRQAERPIEELHRRAGGHGWDQLRGWAIPLGRPG